MADGKDCGTYEGGVLVMQDRMAYAGVAKVDVNLKSDDPEASGASNGSNIDTPNINVKIGMRKPCAVAIALFQYVYLRKQALHKTH